MGYVLFNPRRRDLQNARTHIWKSNIFEKDWGECRWDYISTQRPDEQSARCESAERCGFEPRRLERSLRAAVSSQLVTPVFFKSTANAAKDYIVSETPDAGSIPVGGILFLEEFETVLKANYELFCGPKNFLLRFEQLSNLVHL